MLETTMSIMTSYHYTSQELVVGLVAPIGTDLGVVCDAIAESLKSVNYSVELVRLSQLLDTLKGPAGGDWPELKKSPETERYHSYMNGGNAFRRIMKRGDALALLAVGAIRELRESRSSPDSTDNSRRAYILRSLKHPAEVESLRRIYGPAFALFSVWSPPSTRTHLLAGRIAASHHEFQSRQFLPEAAKLIVRDESEQDDSFGQNVRKTFPLGDFFINARSAEDVFTSVARAIELLFGNVFVTPSRDECGMFHAQAAALRSSSLQRQVGAVISTPNGDIIAVGANEVPRPGGGLYWAGDSPDCRDFKLGHESNDILKRRMLCDLLNRLQNDSHLAAELDGHNIEEIVKRIEASGALRGAHLMNVIEFGRCVHAEMAAIVDAARRGASVNGATLFTTTFPCHECARHIVAAGIHRVVFVEPYPKSLVNELYPDSIQVEADRDDGQHVIFEPFVGVAPRRYFDLFSLGGIERKDSLGKMRKWDRSVAMPRLGEYSFRTELINKATELREFGAFAADLQSLGLTPTSDTRGSAESPQSGSS